MIVTIAQVFRALGAICSFSADGTSNKHKIFLYNGLSNLFCGIQYALLQAFSGAICSLLALLRNLIFAKKKHISVFTLLIYFIIIILCNITSFTNIISVIPVLLVIIYTMALFSKDVLKIKIAVLINAFLEIIYDYYYSAWVGIIVCIIAIIVVLISIYINYIRKDMRRKWIRKTEYNKKS